jgi:hypothetical protein
VDHTQQLVERDRIVAHAHAGGVVDRVRHRRRHAADAQFAHALGLHRRRAHRIGLVEEDHFLVRDVGMHRHLVAGQVVVDEEADALVDHQVFHQRRADAHRHRADHLAARRLRVQDAARPRTRPACAARALAGGASTADFDEVGAEGRLLVFLVQVAVFHRVLGHQFAARAACAAAALAAGAHHAVRELGRGAGSRPSCCATISRSLTQAAYTPAVELLPPHWPPEPADTGKLESPRRTDHRSSGTPIISAAVWAMMV